MDPGWVGWLFAACPVGLLFLAFWPRRSDDEDD